MKLPSLVLVVCLLVCGAAFAQPANEADAARARASALTRDAARAFQSGDYATALARFQEAYAVFPSPRLLFNLGQSYERLARYVEATESFQRFLAAGSVPPGAQVQAEKAIESMRNKVAHVEVAANMAGAEVSIDGRPYGLTPLPRAVMVAVGPHQVVVQKAGAELFSQRIDAVGGAIAHVDAQLRPIAAAPPPPPEPARAPPVAAPPPPASAPVQVEARPAPEPPPAPSVWRKVGLGMMLAAPVVAALGLYYGSHARDQAHQIEEHCATACAGKDIVDTDSARRDNGTRQWVLLGAGGAILAGGAALFIGSSF